jgi:hypothetical protein
MSDCVQFGLNFDGKKEPTIDQDFLRWKELAGAKQILREVYRRAAPYGARYLRTGQRVSFSLIWELCRDHISVVHARCRQRGIKMTKWRGYSLNNNFHGLIPRHIIEHRPEWGGLFELRDRTGSRKVIEEKVIKIRRFV